MAGNIGIIGRARVGKDTAGEWFVRERGYTRVSFADPLKEVALRLNSVVGCFPDEETHVSIFVRLAEVVGSVGWETAKSDPEIRRILQELGMAIRAIDPEFWLRTALKRVQEVNESGFAAVITDVRFPNEADSLKRSGFKLIHIDRPGVPHLEHASEGAVGPEDAHFLVRNDSTVDEMYQTLAWISDEIDTLESARHHARSLS